MKYLIDGYNLIGKIDKIPLSDPQKEEKLIVFITCRGVIPKDRFMIVFDGQDPNVEIPRKELRDAFTLYFTAYSESADAYMIRTIESQPPKSPLVIVSSDNDILFAAKRARLKHMKSEHFLRDYRHVDDSDVNDEKPHIGGDVDYWLTEFGE